MAISQEEMDDAVQANLAAKAQAAAARATRRCQARLNLEFTRIVSPVDGVAGLVQRSDRGSAWTGERAFLTTVSTIDPIKAYFPISEQSYLEFGAADEPNAAGIPGGMPRSA
jgi:membrane fusion protein (multidrug efflux system)